MSLPLVRKISSKNKFDFSEKLWYNNYRKVKETKTKIVEEEKRMKTYMLTALTAQGFGGEDVYREVIETSSLSDTLRNFAIKYGVGIDSITVEEVK